MATRGSKKELSVRHEQQIAEIYGGQRSNSSGGAVTDEGDVRVVADNTLFECKGKFGPMTGAAPVRSTVVSQFTKIADEAWQTGKEPALALRFYLPGHLLADNDGWIDLVVRLAEDDAYRSERLAQKYSCGEEGRCR